MIELLNILTNTEDTIHVFIIYLLVRENTYILKILTYKIR